MSEINQCIQDLLNLDLSDEKRTSVQNRLLELARTNPEDFHQEVHKIGPDTYEPLFEVYEALSFSKDEWIDFAIDEIQRLIQLAKGKGNKSSIFMQLDAFALFCNSSEPSRKKIADCLLSYVSETDPQTRYYAIDTLADFATVENSHVRSVWEKVLTHDKDWRIRYASFLILEEQNALPKSYSRPILDVIRTKVQNPFKF